MEFIGILIVAFIIVGVLSSFSKKAKSAAATQEQKQLDAIVAAQQKAKQQAQNKNEIFEESSQLNKPIAQSHKHEVCQEERSITFHKHQDCVDERNDHSKHETQEVEFEEDYKIALSDDEVKNAIIWGEILNNPAFKRRR